MLSRGCRDEAPRPTARFLTLRDAELEYDICYAMLWSWVDKRLLQRLDSEVTGRAILVKRADLETFLEEYEEYKVRS